MLNRVALQNICRAAIAEDVGSGDATTLAVVDADADIAARMVTREDCVCAGLVVVEVLFAELDRRVTVETRCQDGQFCGAGRTLAVLNGPARSVLTGERTALNFLQRLSGIATLTRRYVDALGTAKTRILDTRKTTPGLRLLEKYAVQVAGGQNHRFGLYDRIMIKDNHRIMARSSGPAPIRWAVAECRRQYPSLEVEVEADTLDDVEEALAAQADYILLDNMSDDELAAAVNLARGKALLEASGGITLERIPRISGLGLDFISVGALTHSAPSIDISLEVDAPDEATHY